MPFVSFKKLGEAAKKCAEVFKQLRQALIGRPALKKKQRDFRIKCPHCHYWHHTQEVHFCEEATGFY